MIEWLRKRSLPVRVFVYIVVAALTFAVAVGVGMIVALTLTGEPGLLGGEPRQDSEQEAAPEPQRENEQEAAPEPQREKASPQQNEAEYLARIGDIQAMSVETFVESDENLLRYDALTADDVEEMRVNQAALRVFADQIDELDPPEKYGKQYEIFDSAINELYEAARLAYHLAANPTAATQADFDAYRAHVDRAATNLQLSNKILDRDYKTIQGSQVKTL